MFPFFRDFRAEAFSKGSRSTALKPLNYLAGMVLAAFWGAAKFGLPYWVNIVLLIALGLIILSYLFTYFFLLWKDRDSLRSETYSLQKMAMAKGLYGDSLAGLFKSDVGLVAVTGSSKDKKGS